jgi:flagellar motor protein MotB
MEMFSVKRFFIMAGMFIMSLTTLSLSGQDHKKAMNHFEKASALFHQSKYTDAELEADKAIRADTGFADPYILKGSIYLETGREADAADLFRKALTCNPDRPELLLNLLGNTLFKQENYQEAVAVFERLLLMQEIRNELRQDAEKKLQTAVFRDSLMKHPLAFNPVNLGKAINTPADEYVNALAADGSGIYFTRKEPAAKGAMRKYDEDLYYAAFSNDTAPESAKIDYPPGKDKDAGALCISADGRLLVYTACYRNDSYGSCDLYFAEKTGSTWSAAQNMGKIVNSTSWDAQPGLSPDGRTLYFASSRPGGYGGSDIWKTSKLDDGSWTKPENLGPSINTTSGEMAPFIHYDGQTLYFSSAGHMGMGGADLFKSVLENGKWSEPVNLGYPINSSADELVVIVNPQGDKAYISRNDRAGEGGYDLFVFEMTEGYRPIPVTYLKGIVSDRESGRPLRASFLLIALENDSLIIRAESDAQTGEFLVCLPLNHIYALHVSCEGYLFYSEHFALNEMKAIADPVQKNILLEPIVVGNTMVLRNIFYETGQYELKSISFPELNKLAEFLQANPGIRVEIGGHTDNVGSEEDNFTLSLNRAGAVYQYLVKSGIAPERMTRRGYGETRPVAENMTESGMALNRRTEITILE